MTGRRIPPIPAIRAFEAAARHMSFTRAAEELNVTQAAVSYQVRQLEQEVGVALFRRLHRNLVLTAAARAYLPTVRRALDLLSEGTRLLEDRAFDLTLRVSATQSLSSRWLAHRIRRFASEFPEYDIRIDATDDLTDFTRGDDDLAIRYAPTIDPGLASVLLSTDRVFPVCSPLLLKGNEALEREQDLLHHTLLSDEMHDVGWPNWLAAAGVVKADLPGTVHFSHSGLTVDAAVAGQGVALGRSLLVADDLAAGRLVRPFDLALTSRYAYYLVYPSGSSDRAGVRAFREWLLREARESESVSVLRGAG